MCQKMQPMRLTTNTVIKINIGYYEFPEKQRASWTSGYVCYSPLFIWKWLCRALLLNSGENKRERERDRGRMSRRCHFLLGSPETFHIPHYHNWACFCSPLSITRIYCNKFNLVSAASLDLPEFVISGARRIRCNLICALPPAWLWSSGPWWDRPIRFALINCCRTRGQLLNYSVTPLNGVFEERGRSTTPNAGISIMLPMKEGEKRRRGKRSR